MFFFMVSIVLVWCLRLCLRWVLWCRCSGVGCFLCGCFDYSLWLLYIRGMFYFCVSVVFIGSVVKLCVCMMLVWWWCFLFSVLCCYWCSWCCMCLGSSS